MLRFRGVLAAFMLSAALAHPLQAQNAIVNAEFDADPSMGGNGWTQGGAFGSSWNELDGSPAAPSAQLAATSTVVDDLLTQCVDLSTPAWSAVTSFAFGGRAKLVQATGTISIRLDFYAGTSCGGGSLANATAPSGSAVANGFLAYASSGIARPATTGSALLTLRLHTTAAPDNPAIGRIDHVFVTMAGANGVVNGEFDADPTLGGSGWTQGGALGSSWNTGDGSPAFGSAQLVTSSQALDDTLLQCVDLTADALAGAASFDFGTRLKNVQFVGSATMTVDFFATSTCTGANNGTSTTNATSAATNGFTELTHLGAARPASTNGARITLRLHDGSSNPDNPAIALFDHVFLGPVGTTPVALQSFDAR